MGGLCSRDEPAKFDDLKQGNHSGPSSKPDNVGQPHNDAAAANSDALKLQLQQLQAAKDAAAEALQALQAKYNGLQRDYESASSAADGAKAETERKLAEVQKQYSELKSDLATGHAEPQLPPQLPVREAGQRQGGGGEQPCSAAEERSRGILATIRDCNSYLNIAFWRSTDFRSWHGVRLINGDVTGLALNNMQLTVLPSEVGQLTGLTALALSNNGLTELPSTLGHLTGVTSLLLDGNILKQLPAELCDLTRLQTLWIQGNQLVSLPHALGKLSNLRQLIANDNALEQLPPSIGELKALTSLWLDKNKIAELPETLSQLTELKRLRVDPPLARLLPEHLRGKQGGGAAQQPAAAASTAAAAVGVAVLEVPLGHGTEELPDAERAALHVHNKAAQQRRPDDGGVHTALDGLGMARTSPGGTVQLLAPANSVQG